LTEASFDQGTLNALDGADEVYIETRMDESSPEHSTIIWVVVVDGGVFVRSVRGEKGRWYREISANPEAALRMDDRRIPVRAVHDTDAEVVEKVNDAYREKYEASYPGPTAGIVREEVLQTTLRLLPA
jgi:hypothetical protein